ncbi:hypothetical protein C0J52_26406, partial [Blattella germanica]
YYYYYYYLFFYQNVLRIQYLFRHIVTCPPKPLRMQHVQITNTDLIDIKIGRLRWAGHIQRMKTSERLEKLWKLNRKEDGKQEDPTYDGWMAYYKMSNP